MNEEAKTVSDLMNWLTRMKDELGMDAKIAVVETEVGGALFAKKDGCEFMIAVPPTWDEEYAL